jgi:hypothetical protein
MARGNDALILVAYSSKTGIITNRFQESPEKPIQVIKRLFKTLDKRRMPP